MLSIRLSSEVVAYFKAGGAGWQTRLDAALRAIVHETREAPKAATKKAAVKKVVAKKAVAKKPARPARDGARSVGAKSVRKHG
ncbi:BrnA antitoxin family protein [Methylovirgula sp. HY1]|uniref:BrnA antitoxin family protein n=1 Tax=Methylovirgula sp. HY1 TaxID=2822761 RepID=UPI001C78D6BD|nr:BrnA antitoxin family protein [Methylovirgula sp. HY1]QXX75283.1 hypothetical protein MHY1_02102 [Methylovirgula sp. HY1]